MVVAAGGVYKEGCALGRGQKRRGGVLAGLLESGGGSATGLVEGDGAREGTGRRLGFVPVSHAHIFLK